MALGVGKEADTDGRRIYAVGDVHGRFDCLTTLLAEIKADLRASPPSQRPMLIFVGDYVDRGPDTRMVLEALCRLAAAKDFELVTLRGNHEELFLGFLNDSERGAEWMACGGHDTLNSYGVTLPSADSSRDGWAQTQAELKTRVPSSHQGLLERMPSLYSVGGYAFVHAGIRPGVQLKAQSERDLLWIREPFLSSNARHEKVIVHGHTPVDTPFDGRYRINVDTGAYATGVLTAVRLDGAERGFLHGTAKARSLRVPQQIAFG